MNYVMVRAPFLLRTQKSNVVRCTRINNEAKTQKNNHHFSCHLVVVALALCRCLGGHLSDRDISSFT